MLSTLGFVYVDMIQSANESDDVITMIPYNIIGLLQNNPRKNWKPRWLKTASSVSYAFCNCSDTPKNIP